MKKLILIGTCIVLSWILSSCHTISSSSKVNLDSSGRPTTSFQIDTRK